MCLAVPARIVDIIDASRARASIGGVMKEIAIDLIDDPQPGEYVVLHVGYALSRLDEDEAERTIAIMEADGRLEEARDEIR